MRIAVRSLFLILTAVLLFNCSGKSAEEYLESGTANIKEAKYEEALKDFEMLIQEFPNDGLILNAYFEIGKLYHGKLIKDFSNIESSEKAIEYYKKVAEDFPDSPLAPNALFMVGFIQANELSQFGYAKKTYTKFIERYPDSELANSAQAELDNLGVPAEEILMKKLKEEN